MMIHETGGTAPGIAIISGAQEDGDEGNDQTVCKAEEYRFHVFRKIILTSLLEKLSCEGQQGWKQGNELSIFLAMLLRGN